MVSPGCKAGDINSNVELTKRMNLIMYHTKNVDALEYLIWDFGSLHGLINYFDLISKDIEMCINTHDKAEYLSAWISLLSKFPESVGSFNQEEVSLKKKTPKSSIFLIILVH